MILHKDDDIAAVATPMVDFSIAQHDHPVSFQPQIAGKLVKRIF